MGRPLFTFANTAYQREEEGNCPKEEATRAAEKSRRDVLSRVLKDRESAAARGRMLMPEWQLIRCLDLMDFC